MSYAAFAITPSDTAALPSPASSIYVGGAGNVTLFPVGSPVAIEFAAVPAGTTIPVPTQQVMATGTSATNLVGLKG